MYVIDTRASHGGLHSQKDPQIIRLVLTPYACTRELWLLISNLSPSTACAPQQRRSDYMSLRMPGSWPANQLSKLLEEFRKDLLHHRYHIQDINDDPKEIFHPDDVTHFWIESPRGFSVSRVESLCRSLLEDKENAPVDDISKEMRKNMLRLVSVMLFCNWGNWDKFKDLILNAQPWPISDKSLPLKLTQIDHYLGGNEEDELDFDRHQWAFIPIIIGTLDRYTNDRYRPPFLRKKTVEIGSGSSAIVHKVVIPKGFYPDDLLAGSMAQKRQRKEANIQVNRIRRSQNLQYAYRRPRMESYWFGKGLVRIRGTISTKSKI